MICSTNRTTNKVFDTQTVKINRTASVISRNNGYKWLQIRHLLTVEDM